MSMSREMQLATVAIALASALNITPTRLWSLGWTTLFVAQHSAAMSTFAVIITANSWSRTSKMDSAIQCTICKAYLPNWQLTASQQAEEIPQCYGGYFVAYRGVIKFETNMLWLECKFGSDQFFLYWCPRTVWASYDHLLLYNVLQFCFCYSWGFEASYKL